MFWGAGLQGMFLSYSHVNNPPLIVRMNQLIGSLPLPVGSVLLGSLPVYPGDEAGDGDPEYQGDHYHGPHHVVFQKLEEKFSITQVDFLKTQAKFCQNSSKILKNSIYRKFQLRTLPPKRLKKPALDPCWE